MLMSTHDRLPSVGPSRQLPMHWPLEHTLLPAHALPQLPQFDGSVPKLTHSPSQRVSPSGHRQFPPVHFVSPVQTVPQLPQLRLSVVRSMHAPPQSVRPGPHVLMHAPVLQTVPFAQLFPHVPQFWGSTETSAHWPLHDSLPAGHRHSPPAHVAGPRQGLLHAPQLFESNERSTQAPPHTVRPESHVPAQRPDEHTRPT